MKKQEREITECTCSFCKTEIEWESSHDVKGIIWSCEKCKSYFCTDCFTSNTGEKAPGAGEYPHVLCQTCFTKDQILSNK